MAHLKLLGFTLILLLTMGHPCMTGRRIKKSPEHRASGNCTQSVDNVDTSFLPLLSEVNSEVRFYPVANETSKSSKSKSADLKRAGKDPKSLIIVAENGKSFIASCANASNLLTSSQKNEITISCKEERLMVSERVLTKSDLACDKKLKEEVTTDGKCDDGYTKVYIGFKTQSKKLPLMTVCHNEGHDETLVVQHSIYGAFFSAADISNNRPSFKEAQFFKKVSANSAYSQNSQKEIVKELVGSASLANKYINPPESLYLARGHLAPDGDFIFAYEQNATYYFINVCPQWQTINNGNWKALEMAARKMASEKKTTLRLWTGVKDILELKDVNNKYVEIFLSKDSAGLFHIPVPKLLWKVLYDEERKSAVAIIMVNNPHNQGVTSSEIICPDICDQISWVKWDTKDIRKGYTYCCSVSDLKRAVGSDVPDLGYVNLLK